MSWYNPLSWFRDIDPFITKDGNFNSEYFIPFGSEDYFFGLSCEADFMRAYLECAPLKSIIHRRASAFNTGQIEIVKTTPSANFVKDADLLNLLNAPNALQTQKQFFSQQNTYIDLHGYCPVLKVYAVGFEDPKKNTPTSIWNIPPWLFDVEYTGKWLKQDSIDKIFTGYSMMWGDGKTLLDTKNVFFIFDDAIGTESNAGLCIPDSRLRGLEYPISNIVGSYKSLNTIINKRGAIGILSNDSKDSVGAIPMDEEEKVNLQKDFKRYGLTGQQFQVIITNANLKWQQMSVPVKDLQLLEGIDAYIKEIARAYGYPSELLSLSDVPYLNRKYCKKELYSDTIIPEGNSRMEQFTNGLIDPEKKIKIQYNFDSIDVLQEEKLLEFQAQQQINVVCQTQFNNGLITKNDWRIKLGLDTLAGDEFNTYKEIQMTIPENTVV